MTEEWRETTARGYEVSNLGRVRSYHVMGRNNGVLSDTPRILKPRVAKIGYLSVSFPGGRVYVHLLVLTAFVGPRPDGMQACHNNGDRADARLVNLRWDTPAANYRDTLSHGTQSRGERHGNSRLTEDDVRAIRASSESAATLAQRYGVKDFTIREIRSRRTWGWLDD